jgi:hypothetical protein
MDHRLALFALPLVVACGLEPTVAGGELETTLRPSQRVAVEGTATPATARPGDPVTIDLVVTSAQETLVDVTASVVRSSGSTLSTGQWTSQALSATSSLHLQHRLTVPSNEPAGTKTVTVLVRRAGGGRVLFNEAVVTAFDVVQSAADSGASTPDAGSQTPDAGPTTPDAGTGTPDAGTATPCSGPLTIITGGTYTGCYQSTDSRVAAVRIGTTQSVTLSHMQIRHAGVGVDWNATRSNLTVVSSTFTALAPSSSNPEQQAVRMYQPATLVLEHNRFIDGHGVQINGENVQTNTLRISYNDFIDIGRRSQPALYMGAVHTDKLLAPGGTILWNRVTNHRGRSHAEDVFGLTGTRGASGNPLMVAHNLVNGAYPFSGDGSGFTGGAFDFADISGAYIEGHHNYAVNYTNNGFMIPSGTEVHHRDSVAVYDGIADDGQRVSSTFGGGFTTWHNSGYPSPSGIGVTGCRAGHLRWTGSNWERADYYLPEGTNSGNTSLGTVNSAAEQAAIDEFENSAKTNAVTIGPLP